MSVLKIMHSIIVLKKSTLIPMFQQIHIKSTKIIKISRTKKQNEG